MDKIACFFNGPYLGGAERSFVLQIGLLKELFPATSVDIVLPFLDDKDETQSIVSFLKDNKFSKDCCSYFPYDKSLFGVSRSHSLLNILFAFWGLVKTIRSLFRYELRFHSKWWVNGNKIGFVCFFYGIITFFRGHFIWHFRDYPATSKKWSIVWFLLNIPRPFRLELVANSEDVANSLRRLNIRNAKVSVLYNPVSSLPLKGLPLRKHQDVNIGVVAMSAPWKGLHDIILFSSLYEKELIDLGISKISLYGGSIYKTSGEHGGYYEEIKSLTKKLDNNLIHFAGLLPPAKVFNEVDILIHSSNKPEPFGRVIVEAFASGIPVISTGLGGAAELVEHNVTGRIYNKMLPDSLFDSIKFCVSKECNEIIINGFKFYEEISDKIKIQLHDILKD